jgi:hypothetical protein
MSELRTRMDNDMVLRGMAVRTREAYLNAVRGLAKFYRRSPDQLSEQEVQGYLLHLLQERGLSWSSCDIVVHGLNFFYRITLGRPEAEFCIPRAFSRRVYGVTGVPEVVGTFCRGELVQGFTDRAPERIASRVGPLCAGPL